jgi:mRNA-degrading endonuclease HigB of HigAB toxin-antitoxin module
MVARKHLSKAMEQYQDVAGEIQAWAGIAASARWHNFAEARERFKDADYVHGYAIFNIRRNPCRLITVIHYTQTTDNRHTDGRVYIPSLLTHKEYDNRNNRDRRFESK